MPSPDALLASQTRAREALRSRVEAILARTWNALGSWRGDDVERFLSVVVPVIEAAQMQTAAVTEVYLAGLLSEMLGEEIAPAGVSGEMTALRSVPTEDVYRRPFVATWTALSNGAEIAAAVSVGADRLLRIADDDLSLAHRHTALTVIRNTDSVTGFRRVIRPELSRGRTTKGGGDRGLGTCGLCIAASNQVYKRDDLLPIHTRCHCDVMPIVRASSGTESDPGRRVNREDLDALYAEAGSTNRKDLKNPRVVVAEHGELGPVLRRSGDEFTGPGDIAA